MSALNEADFGSDTDDDDYVPEGETHDHEASEEENSGVEEHGEESGTTKPKKKKKGKKVVKGRQNIFSEGEEKINWQEELAEERKEINEEKEKQKADDLFAAFKRDTKSVKKDVSKKSSIASLFDDSSKKPESVQSIPKQSGTNRLASLFGDVSSSKPSEKGSQTKPKSLLSGLFDDDKTTCESQTEQNNETAESGNKSDKIEITKVFDFAGETVTVTKQVSAESNEAKKFIKSQETPSHQDNGVGVIGGTGAKRPGGLAGIVGNIGKKQKMGVLDKSKLDWNSFVSEEGISEELKTHNKGEDG